MGYPLELPLYLSMGKYIHYLFAPFINSNVVRNGLEQLVFHKETISEEQVQAYFLPYRLPGGMSAAVNTLKNFDI